MQTFVQDDRPIAVETPLGKDRLALTSFTGTEQMSGLFSFQLQLVSREAGIKAKEIVGQPVDFFVRYPDEQPRFFNGYVHRFSYSGADDRGHRYYAQVVPWLWFLTRTTDCRIFQNQTAPEIITQIFTDCGFSDFSMNVQLSDYQQREYCVQYRESDFAFVSRLMEEEGIYYYFRHERGKHTLVMADSNDAYQQCKDAEVQLLSNLSQPEITDQINHWEHEYEFTSGKWAHRDFNFEDPTGDMHSQTKSIVSLPRNGQYEFYNYPGDFPKKSDGDRLVKLRMEEEEAAYELVSGGSECRSFSPGGKFKLKKHHTESEAGGEWVLTSVHHRGHLGGSYIPGVAPPDDIYKNTFTCIPQSRTFRPPRTTVKPTVNGIQTAIVVGTNGEEIETDKYGRVKVQFHWDREGKKDEKSSCWIRVSTPWSGKHWGMIHIPRVGQEVVVSFLEGDPDRPLVTGMVYNADTMPPWTLPKNKSQSGIKTHSTKGSGDENFNELRFEDKRDEEEIYFHAERDFHRVVENDDTLKVGFDKQDPGNQTIEVFNNRTLTVEQGDREATVKQGNDCVTVSMGNREVHVEKGGCTIEAFQFIELVVGKSKIRLDPSGITMSGMNISIDGTTAATINGKLAMTVKSELLTKVNGKLAMIN